MLRPVNSSSDHGTWRCSEDSRHSWRPQISDSFLIVVTKFSDKGDLRKKEYFNSQF